MRKAGGVVVPPDAVRDEKGKPEQVLFLPELFWREIAAALVLLAAVTLFSALVRAPLGPPANPGLSLNPAKAPWYFLGFQELLVHLHPLFAVVVVPLLGVGALCALPYLGFSEDEPRGAWFLSENGRRTAQARGRVPRSSRRRFSSSPTRCFSAEAGRRRGRPRSCSAASCRWPRSSPVPPRASALLRSRFGATRLEATQALFVFFATAFAVLTATRNLVPRVRA